MPIISGRTAPDFTLPDENGKLHKLKDYRGKTVVLFFYPADHTPGCTVEACNFRDDYLEYRATGAVLLGISPDDVDSHSSFKAKFRLPYPLLADVGHKIADKYGVWGDKVMFGRHYKGLLRTTFVIDGKGKIAKVFPRVSVRKHSEDVLASLQELSG